MAAFGANLHDHPALVDFDDLCDFLAAHGALLSSPRAPSAEAVPTRNTGVRPLTLHAHCALCLELLRVHGGEMVWLLVIACRHEYHTKRDVSIRDRFVCRKRL